MPTDSVYRSEELQTIQSGDRRCRDVYPNPERRKGDAPATPSKAKISRIDYAPTKRELELLSLIDGHIERIRLASTLKRYSVALPDEE